MRIGFLGGDERMVFAAALAAADGHTVALSHLPRKDLPLLSPTELFAFAEALILPLPTMKDGVHIGGTSLTLKDINLTPGTRVFGGMLPPVFYRAFPHAYDYYGSEELLRENAHLTAEGGVATALRATGRGFSGMDAAVIGYGRIGSALAPMLAGFGMPVTVYVRRLAAAEKAKAAGFTVRPLGKDFLPDPLPGEAEAPPSPFRISEKLLFGTVPAPIYREADAPAALFAFDLGGGMKGGLPLAPSLRVNEMRGVPGLFAPAAAGEIIYRVLSPLLS